jgi:hypothetical protein
VKLLPEEERSDVEVVEEALAQGRDERGQVALPVGLDGLVE